MIEVVFCGGDLIALVEMQKFLNRYCPERGREIASVPFRSPMELLAELEFCEGIHRTPLFHLRSGKVLESTGGMDELGRRLDPYGCFLRVHHSYTVNLDYVQNISHRAVTMTGLTEIPIPGGKYNEIKDAFWAHAFQNRQVAL